MGFGQTGNTFIQSGVDTDLSGLAGIANATVDDTESVTSYNLGDMDLEVRGTLSIAANALEQLIVTGESNANTVSKILVSGGTLIVGDPDIADDINTRNNKIPAIITKGTVSNNPTGFIRGDGNFTPFRFPGLAVQNGGVVRITGVNAVFFTGIGVKADSEIHLKNTEITARNGYVYSTASTFENVRFGGAFNVLQAYTTFSNFLIENSSIATYLKAYLNISSSTPLITSEIRDVPDGNYNFIGVWGSPSIPVYNCVNAFYGSAYLSSNRNLENIQEASIERGNDIRFRKDIEFQAEDFDGDPIDGAIFYGTGGTVTTPQPSWDGEDIPIVQQTQNNFFYLTDSTGSTGDQVVILGANINTATAITISYVRASNDDMFTIVCVAYLFLVSISPQSMKGNGKAICQKQLFGDTAITETDKAVVDALTEIDTLTAIYDRYKSFGVDSANVGYYKDHQIEIVGPVLDLKAQNLIVRDNLASAIVVNKTSDVIEIKTDELRAFNGVSVIKTTGSVTTTNGGTIDSGVTVISNTGIRSATNLLGGEGAGYFGFHTPIGGGTETPIAYTQVTANNPSILLPLDREVTIYYKGFKAQDSVITFETSVNLFNINFTQTPQLVEITHTDTVIDVFNALTLSYASSTITLTIPESQLEAIRAFTFQNWQAFIDLLQGSTTYLVASEALEMTELIVIERTGQITVNSSLTLDFVLADGIDTVVVVQAPFNPLSNIDQTQNDEERQFIVLKNGDPSSSDPLVNATTTRNLILPELTEIEDKIDANSDRIARINPDAREFDIVDLLNQPTFTFPLAWQISGHGGAGSEGITVSNGHLRIQARDFQQGVQETITLNRTLGESATLNGKPHVQITMGHTNLTRQRPISVTFSFVRVGDRISSTTSDVIRNSNHGHTVLDFTFPDVRNYSFIDYRIDIVTDENLEFEIDNIKIGYYGESSLDGVINNIANEVEEVNNTLENGVAVDDESIGDIGTRVRTELATELARLDANISSRSTFNPSTQPVDVDRVDGDAVTIASFGTNAVTEFITAGLVVAENGGFRFTNGAVTVLLDEFLRLHNFDPATQGVTLSTAGITNVTTAVQAGILNEADGQAVIQAIVNAIGNQNITSVAIATQVRTELATELARIDADISSRSTFDNSSEEVNIGEVKGTAVASIDDFKATSFSTSTLATIAQNVWEYEVTPPAQSGDSIIGFMNSLRGFILGRSEFISEDKITPATLLDHYFAVVRNVNGDEDINYVVFYLNSEGQRVSSNSVNIERTLTQQGGFPDGS